MAALLPQVIEEHSATSGSWLAPLRDWPAAVVRLLQSNSAVVRIVIAAVRGSSPREAGTCMLVDGERIFGTIGGGQLEWAAIAAARVMLADTGSATVQLQKLILGPQLSQCCGGAVELWLERYTHADVAILSSAADAATRGPALLLATLGDQGVERRIIRHPTLDRRTRDLVRTGTRAELIRHENDTVTLQERLDDNLPNVWLYGAGHVGQALARVLATLPLRLTWIDSRADLLPNDLAESVGILVSSDPATTVMDAPRGTRFLVMTHSHPLDYALCKAVLERNERAWIGVIGSKSKGARFRSRLLHDGLSRDQSARLVCPIGVDGVDSKLPAVIAVSVATQLLQTFEASARSLPAEHAGHDCASGGCANCSLQPGAAK